MTPTATRSLLIRLVDAQGTATTRSLDHFPFTIGRDSENSMILRDNRVSRKHARIVSEDSQVIIEDLGSRHGVRVNGQNVQRAALTPGDRIDFGLDDSYSIVLVENVPAFLAKTRSKTRFTTTPAPATAPMSKLCAMLEVTRAMHGALGTDEILNAILDAALQITSLERGVLLLRENKGFVVRAERSRSEVSISLPLEAIEYALDTRKDLFSLDPDLPLGPNSNGHHLLVPLVQLGMESGNETAALSARQATVGVIYLDSEDSRADLSSGGREMLQALAMEASQVLEHARLLEASQTKQRIEQELKLARMIQANLLPRECPKLGWMRASGGSLPSQQVSGDFFDFVPLENGNYLAALADVSGKGVSSALLSSLVQGALLGYSRNMRSEDMARGIEDLSALLYRRARGEKYATLFVCSIEPDGRMVYVNAAHPAAMLLRRDLPVIELESTSTPIGLLRSGRFKQSEVQLEPGDLVVILSDGVAEAQNPEGEYFDQLRLPQLLKQVRGSDCLTAYEHIMNELPLFTGTNLFADDASLLVLEYAPESAA